MNEEFDTRMRREEKAKFLPPDFFDILFNRYFPVAALTYIGTLLGIAFRNTTSFASLLNNLFFDPTAYHMSLIILCWTSLPAIFWIIIRSSLRYAPRADIWYKGIAGLMILTLMISFVLFPEWDFGNRFRMFFVATIPVFIVQYWFFVRGGLPAKAAWPLTVIGLSLMIYGIVIV
jgi:magnesium-transporting ATPase (P-type)